MYPEGNQRVAQIRRKFERSGNVLDFKVGEPKALIIESPGAIYGLCGDARGEGGNFLTFLVPLNYHIVQRYQLEETDVEAWIKRSQGSNALKIRQFQVDIGPRRKRLQIINGIVDGAIRSDEVICTRSDEDGFKVKIKGVGIVNATPVAPSVGAFRELKQRIFQRVEFS